MSDQARKLALEIGRCSNFVDAINGETNACSSVVHWQRSMHGDSAVVGSQAASTYHCPEPWAGNLVDAPIMFLSSNPSFDPRENFPTLDWDESRSADFFVNRFTQDRNREYGATDGPSAKDLDRVVLKDGTLTSKVKTWYSLRSRASILLDKPVESTLASRDYVMTEVVHCKSQREHGVAEALPTCVGKWLAPKLKISSARLIIVSGSHAGMAVKRAVLNLSGGTVGLASTWGSWQGDPPGNGTWPKSWKQLESWKAQGAWSVTEQTQHFEKLRFNLDGSAREFTFMWMPHSVRSVPQNLANGDLYDPEVLQMLRKLVSQ